MKNKKWILISLIIIAIVGWIFTYFTIFSHNSSQHTATENKSKKIQKKVYEHTLPKRIWKNDYLKWEFITNDSAAVFPRRDAIVQDIFVDIWDKVYAWQTLAILLPAGVDWSASSKIGLKSAIIEAKNSVLDDTLLLKNSKINIEY